MSNKTSINALEVKDVAVSYNGTVNVIEEMNLAIAEGEVFGLVGLNGVGKTTLIKCILGLRTKHDGEIDVFGMDCLSSKARHMLAYLPEKFEPSWFLTGREFIHFALSLSKKKTEDALIDKMATDLSLDIKAVDQRVGSYSKGMKQKIGLMATLLSEAPLYILDEPMSGLDPKARALVKDQISVANKGGATIFFSSHILADVDEICDRIGIIHGNGLIFIGKPSDLKKQTKCDNLERAFLALITEHDEKNDSDSVAA